MGLIGKIFCWWGPSTWGTSWTIFKNGGFVGSDDYGNHYYEQISGVGPHGKPRRWVIYRDQAEASQVPPEWHGWLHHTFKEPPINETYVYKFWQKTHQMNMTGTPGAYRPEGSILNSSGRPKNVGSYHAWKPK
ncbi:MAG: hypothetical protein TECD_00066 [Hyphomicrobiaceae bacterium hypho_1]